MSLPFVLAGPILRRCHAKEINIWIALSRRDPAIQATLTRADSGKKVNFAQTVEEMQLTDNLFIYMVRLFAPSGSFPTETLLLYDLSVLDEVELKKISYPGMKSGSLFLQEGRQKFRALYGSCRKPHGKGGDATRAGDAFMAKHIQNLKRRPHVLLLGGDQIYADDVPDQLTKTIADLGDEITGGRETTPGSQPDWGQRQKSLQREGFSSTAMSNHLLTFGDFCAAYLLAWNPQNWTTSAQMAMTEYHDGSVAIRRLFANVPTYMIFDDHEITDDWNISFAWRNKVKKSGLAKRVLANGMAAYWMFQAIGNDPDRFSRSDVAELIRRHVGNSVRGGPSSAASKQFDAKFLSASFFSFATPTHPPVIFADTRTTRDQSSKRSHISYNPRLKRKDVPEAPRLMKDKALKQLSRMVRAAGRRVIIVTPTPVFGVGEIELPVEGAVTSGLSSRTADFESYHADRHSFIDFANMLLHPGGGDNPPDLAVILSGDVHYAFSKAVSLMDLDKNFRVDVAQFTSSATKNEPVGKDEALLDLFSDLKWDPINVQAWWRPGGEGSSSSDALADRARVQPKGGGNIINLDNKGVVSALDEIDKRGGGGDAKFIIAESYEPVGKKIVLKTSNIGLLELNGTRVRHKFLTWTGKPGTAVSTDWRTSRWPVKLQ